MRLTDAEVIAGWAADLQFCRAAGWTLDLPPSEHLWFQRDSVLLPRPDLIRMAAMSQGTLVGYVDLAGRDPHRRELGFLIGPLSSWGHGLGSQAAAAGLAYGFDALGLKEIWAEALDTNVRSVRILHRLGLTETGRGGMSTYLDQDSAYLQFAITADAWAARPGQRMSPRLAIDS